MSSKSDGATTIATGTFAGSGFTADMVGKYLRIHGGADAGVYRISAFTNANSITLQKLNPGTAFNAAATANTLTYTIWTPTTTASGAESASCYLANGVGRDNTQDIFNILVDFFLGKTTLYDETEAVKFAVGLIGPRGSPGVSVYSTYYTKATNPNYRPGLGAHLAISGGALTRGEELLDYTRDDTTNGTSGQITSGASDNTWGGRNAAAGTQGYAVTVDLGLDVEVGAVVARFTDIVTLNQPIIGYGSLATAAGNISNLYKKNTAGGAPADSSTVRTSGTNLAFTVGTQGLTLSGGQNFLGPLVASAADGATTALGNTFTSAAGRFTGRVGMVIVISAGADAGSYRITAVDGTGAVATIRNLNQTAKAWGQTASGISFEVRDAVREEDQIAVPNNGAATHRFVIERLTSTTTAEIRVYPSATLSGQTWECVSPSWDLVKRVSPSPLATPPDPTNNKTFVSTDGRERGFTGAAHDAFSKIVLDLSDLTSAQRTGRYWRFQMMPRNTANTTVTLTLHSVEFYAVDGKRLMLTPDTQVDAVEALASYYGAYITRAEWIQAANDGASHVAGSNGLATLGGSAGEQVTLAGANRFLGYQVRTGADGSVPGGDGTFNVSGAFLTSDIGRIIRITTGANAGYYRIASRPLTTQAVLTTPGGNAVTLTADAGPVSYALHEGIQTGTTIPDYIRFGNGQVYSIFSISDDLKTITLNEHTYGSFSGQTWEIRRRALPSTATAVDGTQVARILQTETPVAPLQSGDFAADSSGSVVFWPDDVKSRPTLTDGQGVIGAATFNGSTFTPDDVGRLVVITTGGDTGHYRIATYVSPTQVTLKDARTGAASVLTDNTAGRSYYVRGDRRFRFSRVVGVARP